MCGDPVKRADDFLNSEGWNASWNEQPKSMRLPLS
jgi:hypothetical protein